VLRLDPICRRVDSDFGDRRLPSELAFGKYNVSDLRVKALVDSIDNHQRIFEGWEMTRHDGISSKDLDH
jgi:uncharacterized Ntn-hydrolase superfamily protein